jgi:hypothetical protein
MGSEKMARTHQFARALVFASSALAATWVVADDVRIVEDNGIKYQETTQRVQRLIPETRYEQREYTSYQERYTTDMQEVQRTYQVPVTRQEWVPGYQRTWNVFAPPVLSYRLLNVTRMETKNETVRVPVTKRELIPQKQVQQVPVTTTKLAEETHTHRIAVGTVQGEGGGALMADRAGAAGGTKLESDPPRTGNTGWQGARP